MILYVIATTLFMIYAIISNTYTLASLKIVTDRPNELTLSERAIHYTVAKLHN